MATNLVSLIMQFLTPDMIGRIAGVLGLDRSKTGTAISAAVPSLLAALSNVAAQPGGHHGLSALLETGPPLAGTPGGRRGQFTRRPRRTPPRRGQ